MPDETPKPQPVHPGDIVQITELDHRWFPALLVVDEVRGWGVQATCYGPVEGGVGAYPSRLQRGSFEVVGAVALLSPEQAKAREQSLASVEQD